jgi:hypothetical protein
VSVVAGRVPVFVGVGGNATTKVLRTLRRLERYRFEGIVSVCPYYFTRIAEATDRKIRQGLVGQPRSVARAVAAAAGRLRRHDGRRRG